MRRGERFAIGLGLFGHVLAGAILYLPAGLVAPPWGVIGLWAWWIVLLVAAIRVRRRRPYFVGALPVIAIGSWFLVLLVGDVLLGWTA